ncbi:hypothetical protein BRC81_15515 [Halobacteriales archaeon QS_1_68_20]|nr:MAG: hypothetical protein BRC81_15515 [Halobacteriales archaeon QS_1_68_20]
MSNETSFIDDDHVDGFLVGGAAVTGVSATVVVALELHGAASGDPVDPSLIALALLSAFTTVGALVVHRREN